MLASLAQAAPGIILPELREYDDTKYATELDAPQNMQQNIIKSKIFNDYYIVSV